ncbi:MAG: family transcriptional regulator [Dehalococcoidia bacterium]|nr:family transcriptional regulator [Dehalococcoidia bacterium]
MEGRGIAPSLRVQWDGKQRNPFEVKGVPSTVLIVEDDPNTVELVRLYLSRDGHKVLAASEGFEGLRLAREARPDLVILDLMLPGLDGMEVCRILRKESDVPIVMLTARVEEEDRLAGLDLGADDYVTKPFSPRELAARIRAVLRRTATGAVERGPALLQHGNITANLRLRSVRVGATPVRLTPIEFRLLVLLMREPGRTFTREEIMDRALGDDFDGFDRAVDAHVSNLRRKLGEDPQRPRYIHTIYGVGYRFGDA